jgi:hypothetical protein
VPPLDVSERDDRADTGDMRLPSHHRSARPRAGWAAAAVLLVACAGCAHRPHGTTIDERPTPPQPGPFTTTSPDPTTTATPSPTPAPTNTPPATTGTDTAGASRAAADTLAARKALNRCAGRNLLPEQESTIMSVSTLLRSAHDAMVREDWVRAESLARQARQLAGSLGCP